MKTKLISTLKKELLIVELPKWYKSFNYQKPLLEVRGDEPNLVEFLSLGRYEILGKPDEIKEEDVRELVEILWNGFRNYSEDGSVGNYQRLVYKTALESFHSALESEIYWENPHGKEEPNKSYFLDDNGSFLRQEKKQWYEAQEKTFDKNRTLIFVKN